MFKIKFNKGKSFVTIMIVIAVLALLLRIGLEQVIKIAIAHDQIAAQATIKLISASLENYAKDNHGTYPSSLLTLTQSKPQYLDKDYSGYSSLKGYSYTCTRMDASGYNCSAVPSICQITGKKNFTVTTGGLLVSEECDKKE